MSKLIVFDVDGTILNSFGHFEKVIKQYSRDQGLPMPCMETIKLGYSNPRAHDFRWGVSREEQRTHLHNIFNLGDQLSVSGHPEHTPRLFEGVEESLVHLKDLGHTLAIVTSKPEAPLLHLLDIHDVDHLFSAHRNWDDIKRRGEREKPEPDMLLSVMRELKFAPDETVMIGDATMDIRMGRTAGANTIGVTWGMHPKAHLEEAGAHHIVDTAFSDIAHTIKNIFG